jgi:hypothetical protein
MIKHPHASPPNGLPFFLRPAVTSRLFADSVCCVVRIAR